MSNEGFNFSKFIEDSKNSLMNPKGYFTSMATTGGFVEPIIKAVLYGFVAGIFTFLWGVLKIGAIDAGVFGGMLGTTVGIMGFIWSIIGALIGLFIGGVIMLIISAICGGSTDYEANVRVVASLMVISPIKALFGFLGFISFLGLIVGLAISLYSIWMLYHALNESLKAKVATSKVISIVLAVLLALFTIIGMGAKKAASSFTNSFEDMMDEATEEFQEVMEDATEATEEFVKEMEEVTEEMEESQEEASGEEIKDPE